MGVFALIINELRSLRVCGMIRERVGAAGRFSLVELVGKGKLYRAR